MKRNKILTSAALLVCIALMGIIRLPSGGHAAGGGAAGEGCAGPAIPSAPAAFNPISQAAPKPALASASTTKSGGGSPPAHTAHKMSEPDLNSVSVNEGSDYGTDYFNHAKAFEWNSCIDPFFGQCVEQWGGFAMACNGSPKALLGNPAEVNGIGWDIVSTNYTNQDPAGYPETFIVSMQSGPFERFFPGQRCKDISDTRVSESGGSSCYGGKWNSYTWQYSDWNTASTYNCDIKAPSATNVALTYDTTNVILNGTHTFTHPTGATTERSVTAEIDMASDEYGDNMSVVTSGTQDSDLSTPYLSNYDGHYFRYCVTTSFEAEQPYQYFSTYYPTFAATYAEGDITVGLHAMDQTNWVQTETVSATSPVCGIWQTFVTPPLATNLAISYGATGSNTVTGSYTFSDYENRAESGSTFAWAFGSDPTQSCWTIQDSQSSQSTTVPVANQVAGSCGMVAFCVIPHDTEVAGSVVCTGFSAVGQPSIASVVADWTDAPASGYFTATAFYSGWSDVLSSTTDSGTSYQWMLGSDSAGTDATAISGQTSPSHTITSADVGRYLSVCITPTSNTGATGTPVCPTATWIGPLAENVASTRSGTVLTGSYTYGTNGGTPGEGTSGFQWMRDSNGDGANAVSISGATSTTYTMTQSDAGMYLFFCVVPVDTDGTPGTQTCQSWGTSVPSAPSVSNVTVTTGGGAFTASYTFTDYMGLSDQSTMAWYFQNTTTGVQTQRGTGLTYTPQTADVGGALFPCVVPYDGFLTGSSTCWYRVWYYSGPSASNVAISQGSSSYTGSYTFSDPLSATESGSTYAWYQSSTSSFSSAAVISGATTASFTPGASNAGEYLFFCVSPSNGTATGSQACSSGLLAGPIATNVSQSVSGCTMTGSYTFADNTSTESGSTFAWLRNSSNTTAGATTISGATALTHTAATADDGMFVFFCVTPKSTAATGSQVCSSSGSQFALSASNVVVTQSGSTLTGSYTFSSCDSTNQTPAADLVWWTNNQESFSGTWLKSTATGSTYTAASGDLPYVSFCVTPSDGVVTGATVCSSWLAFIPIATTVTITASGSSLTGSYSYTDYNGYANESTVQWYRSSTSGSGTSGTAISSATGNHYTAGNQDDGKYLSYCVTPINGDSIAGTVVCAQQAVFPTASSVSISGTGQTGQTLTGSYTWSDIAGTSSSGTALQWMRLQQGSWVNVSGATSSTYTTGAPDATTQLEFCVTPSDGPVTGTQVCSSPISISPTITLYTSQNYGGNTWTGVYGSGSCVNLGGPANKSAQSLKWYGVPPAGTTLKIYAGTNCSGTSATYTAAQNTNGAETTLGSMNSLTESFEITW